MSVKTYLRPAKGGKSNIYVDFSVSGKRKRERTKMFLYDKPKSKIEKDHNKKTKKLRETYVAQLTIKIQNNELGIKVPKSKIKDFVQYFEHLTNHRIETGKNTDTWTSSLNHLKEFNPDGLKFSDMNIQWLERFKHFLTDCKKLKSSSSNNYFNVVKHAIHDAFRDRLIDTDFADYVKAPTVEKAIRTYLTEEEVLKLEKVECNIQILKKAFLFACRTGMSFADIKALEWKDLKINPNNENYIDFHRKKTKGLQHHPITYEAREMLGEQGGLEEKVFKNLIYNSWMNIKLQQWVHRAGISKTITFHCARHTYATMLLHKGVAITVVSKLLGHKDLKTTMIYAKVMDEDMRSAAELMQFSNNKKD